MGIVVLMHGVADLTQRSDRTAGTWVAGSIAVAMGISLLIGFLTPIVAVLVGVAAASNPSLFASNLSVAFLSAVAVAVALLGPGAFSLDGRLFGLREIIIPPLHSARQVLDSHDGGVSR